MLLIDTAHSPGIGLRATQEGPQPEIGFARVPGIGAQGCWGSGEAEISALNAEPWPSILTLQCRRSSVSCFVNCRDNAVSWKLVRARLPGRGGIYPWYMGRRSQNMDVPPEPEQQGKGKVGEVAGPTTMPKNSGHARKRPWLPLRPGSFVSASTHDLVSAS